MTKKTGFLGSIDNAEIKNGWASFEFINQRTIFEERNGLAKFLYMPKFDRIKIRFPSDTKFLDEVVNDIMQGKKYTISGFYNTFPASSPHTIEFSGLLTTPDRLNMPPKKSEKDFFFYGKESPKYKLLKREYYLKKADLSRISFEEFESRLGITETRNDIPDYYIDECGPANPSSLRVRDYSKLNVEEIRKHSEKLKKAYK